MVEEVKDLVQIAIKTNEREVAFTSFSGHVLIKQCLDGEVSSVVLTREELDLLHEVSTGNNLAEYMANVIKKAW